MPEPRPCSPGVFFPPGVRAAAFTLRKSQSIATVGIAQPYRPTPTGRPPPTPSGAGYGTAGGYLETVRNAVRKLCDSAGNPKHILTERGPGCLMSGPEDA